MRKKGNFIFPVNFEPTGLSILDARLKVPTKEDLTTGYQDGNYYPKMVVTVEDEDTLYILSKEDPTLIDNWKKLNGGEGFNTISWNNSSNMNNYKDEGIYIISGVRSNSGDNMPISNYNTNGYIGGTLIINKTPEDPETKEYIISLNLVLANKVGGETKEYIRSCIVKNLIETWTPWKESNTIQLFGEKASGLASDTDINAAIDNGLYMGVYTGSTLMSPGSTFIMTVINNYAANAQTGQPNNRQVTQIFFYTPISSNGQINPSNFVKRDGIGGESISWGKIESFGSDSSNDYMFEVPLNMSGTNIDWGTFVNDNWSLLLNEIGSNKKFYAKITTDNTIIPLTVIKKNASELYGSIVIDYLYNGKKYTASTTRVSGSGTTTVAQTGVGYGYIDKSSGILGTGEIFNDSRNNASGECAHAEGLGTTATNKGSHALGTYNVCHSGDEEMDNTIHAVGIGSSYPDNKNAHEIMKNGDHYVYGIGNYNGIDYLSAKTLQEVINEKLDSLVSGTTIKTINGLSILGEGNIEIQGSGGGIADAPSDGNKYVRLNGNWVQETSVDTSAFATKEYINLLLTLEIVE